MFGKDVDKFVIRDKITKKTETLNNLKKSIENIDEENQSLLCQINVNMIRNRILILKNEIQFLNDKLALLED